MGDKPSRRGGLVVVTILILFGRSFTDVAIGAELTATWTDNSVGEPGFSVERSTGMSGAFVELGVTDGGITTYTDTTVDAGMTYCYRVRAFNSTDDYSDYSNVACAAARSDVLFAVVEVGSGDGTVSSNPPGILCGQTCWGAFASGTLVTLTATPTAGSIFTGWSGSGCAGTGPCTMALTTATTMTAAFDLANLPFSTLSIGKSGKGSVTSVPPGIRCGKRCSVTYPTDTVVTLIAIPFPGATFVGWSGGGCSGTDSCVVTATGTKTVEAIFGK